MNKPVPPAVSAGPSPVLAAGEAPTLDMDAYCRRIGYGGARDVSAATLHGLHVAQTHSVPFENLDIHLGRPLSLQPADLFAKIVTRRRGGYCYELNTFFGYVLQGLGFPVQNLVARVLYGYTAPRPRSHQLLLVTAHGEDWIADVGFGLHGMRAPLRFTPETIDRQGPDSYRLQKDGDGEYRLQKEIDGGWADLYAFSTAPQLPVDFIPLNYWNSNAPESPFTQRRICSLPTATGRNVAVNMEFKIRSGADMVTIEAHSTADYLRLLREYFALEVEDAFNR